MQKYENNNELYTKFFIYKSLPRKCNILSFIKRVLYKDDWKITWRGSTKTISQFATLQMITKTKNINLYFAMVYWFVNEGRTVKSGTLLFHHKHWMGEPHTPLLHTHGSCQQQLDLHAKLHWSSTVLSFLKF